MKGSNVVAPLLIVLIVLEAELVPHQLLVTVAAVPLLLRLALVPVAVFPAKRLKLIVRGPAEGAGPLFPVEIPPPLALAVLPVTVTLVKVAESVHVAGQPLGKLLR